MSRYGEFQLGSVTHAHMLALGNAESMDRYHGSWGDYYRKHGNSAGAEFAYKAQKFSTVQAAQAFKKMEPVKREKLHVPQEKPVQFGYKERYN